MRPLSNANPETVHYKNNSRVNFGDNATTAPCPTNPNIRYVAKLKADLNETQKEKEIYYNNWKTLESLYNKLRYDFFKLQQSIAGNTQADDDTNDMSQNMLVSQLNQLQQELANAQQHNVHLEAKMHHLESQMQINQAAEQNAFQNHFMNDSYISFSETSTPNSSAPTSPTGTPQKKSVERHPKKKTAGKPFVYERTLRQSSPTSSANKKDIKFVPPKEMKPSKTNGKGTRVFKPTDVNKSTPQPPPQPFSTWGGFFDVFGNTH